MSYSIPRSRAFDCQQSLVLNLELATRNSEQSVIL